MQSKTLKNRSYMSCVSLLLSNQGYIALLSHTISRFKDILHIHHHPLSTSDFTWKYSVPLSYIYYFIMEIKSV